MLISMAPNQLILGTFSIKETPMFDTITASLSTHLKTQSRASGLPSPRIPTLNFNSKRLCLSSSRPPSLLRQSCDRGLHCWAVRTSSSGDDMFIPTLLERPLFAPKEERVDYEEEEEEEEEEKEEEKVGSLSDLFDEEEDEEEEDGEFIFSNWVDWEDEILRETEPLKRFVKMILHSPRYISGERLTPQDEKIIIEKLLPYHPELEEKVGPGVDFISVDNHPEFLTSRCLFINRKDGESVDFSFWKCLRGLVWKKYPLYAETFIGKYLSPRHS